MRPAVDVRERRARARLLERQLLQLELELVQLLLSREAPVDEARQILGQLHLLLEELVDVVVASVIALGRAVASAIVAAARLHRREGSIVDGKQFDGSAEGEHLARARAAAGAQRRGRVRAGP
jgi:hypothetical protein